MCGASMQRYWNADRGWCYDVLDGPDGNDISLRPNQLFAVGLPASALDDDQARAIVDVCASRLGRRSACARSHPRIRRIAAATAGPGDP